MAVEEDGVRIVTVKTPTNIAVVQYRGKQDQTQFCRLKIV